MYWLESRPHEGRTVLVFKAWQGETQDVVPAGFNVRNGVHEYGGGAYWLDDGTIFFTNFDDQRIYRVDQVGAEPRPITPEPPQLRSLRYADGIVVDGTIVCVRERHGDEVVNELVSLPADGSAAPTIAASGHDFFSSPTMSPDGKQLAYLSWDHPQLPFIGTDLWVGELAGEPRHVAGGRPSRSSSPRGARMGCCISSPTAPAGGTSTASGTGRSRRWLRSKPSSAGCNGCSPCPATPSSPTGRIACILNRGLAPAAHLHRRRRVRGRRRALRPRGVSDPARIREQARLGRGLGDGAAAPRPPGRGV